MQNLTHCYLCNASDHQVDETQRLKDRYACFRHKSEVTTKFDIENGKLLEYYFDYDWNGNTYTINVDIVQKATEIYKLIKGRFYTLEFVTQISSTNFTPDNIKTKLPAAVIFS